jgi:hypothetical protein
VLWASETNPAGERHPLGLAAIRPGNHRSQGAGARVEL